MAHESSAPLWEQIDKISINDKSSAEKLLIDSGLTKDLICKLFDYQKVGVEWLIKKFNSKLGGAILADDMGLGKTVQVLCFLNCMYQQHKIRTILIILPKSLVENWFIEISIWFPDVQCLLYEGTPKQRHSKIANIMTSSGILITTYGMAHSNCKQFSTSVFDIYSKFEWDCVVLDEAHKIRNSTKTTRSIHNIGANFRLAITGTPLQNNMVEMYNLVNFVSNKNNIFGGKKNFENEFSNTITQCLYKDVSDTRKKSGVDKLNDLHQLIIPYVLRRTKNEQKMELLSKMNDCNINKMDLIVWIRLTDYQIEVYRTFLQSEQVQQAIASLHENKSHAFVKLAILRQLPNHPYLSKNYEFMPTILKDAFDTINTDNKHEIDGPINKYDDYLLGESKFVEQFSCKISFTLKLLKNILSDKLQQHKVLIFSQSRQMLDFLAKSIDIHLCSKWLQLDGRSSSNSSRQEIIRTFQNNPDYTILLATIQVGGIGLNLTAADRIIILEPSWNPGTEYQAIDRACRIGQKNNVVVYRLITCGTVEEKMYRKQIFKDGLIKHVVENVKNPSRYFTWLDLKELFLFGDPYNSLTYHELSKLNNPSMWSSHYNSQVETLTKCGAYGINDNGKLYQQLIKNTNIFNEIDQNNDLTSKQQIPNDSNGIVIENIDSLFDKDFENILLSSTRLNSTPQLNLSNEFNNRETSSNDHFEEDNYSSHSSTKEVSYGDDSTPNSITNNNNTLNDHSIITIRRRNKFSEESPESSLVDQIKTQQDLEFDSKADRENFELLHQSFSQCQVDQTSDSITVNDSESYISCESESVYFDAETRCALCIARLELIDSISLNNKCVCSLDEPERSCYYTFIKQAYTYELKSNLNDALIYYIKAANIADSDLNILLSIKRIYNKLSPIYTHNR